MLNVNLIFNKYISMILENIIIGFKYLEKMPIVGYCLLVCPKDNHMEMELFGHIDQEV